MKNISFKWNLLWAIPLVFMSFALHDFYTSMTKVDYNQASATVSFSTKLDVEHLETAIGMKSNAGGFDKAVESYFKSNFTVKINGSSKDLDFASQKITGEVIWVYFNIPNVNSVKTIDVDNTLLFEKYPEQQNFVNFNINGKRESLIAKKGNSSGVKSF